MKVSIALATYNGARFIDEQLQSLAAQTRAPDEIVVSDDGSSDDTIAHVERFARSSPFEIRLFRNARNLGFNGNFERALSLCTGDVIFISDQDDIWYPEKIERSLAALEADRAAALVVNDEHLMDGDGRSMNATFLGNIRKLGYPDDYHCAGCCTAMRRELLEIVLPLGGSINYDLWISNVAKHLGVKRVLDEPLQLYRRHGGNSTETVFAQEGASTWRLFREYQGVDPRPEWEVQIGAFRAYEERIRERRDSAEALAGKEAVAKALLGIDGEIERLTRRAALLDKSRLARLPAVLKLWGEGFYRHFSGGRSALKDIIRA